MSVPSIPARVSGCNCAITRSSSGGLGSHVHRNGFVWYCNAHTDATAEPACRDDADDERAWRSEPRVAAPGAMRAHVRSGGMRPHTRLTVGLASIAIVTIRARVRFQLLHAGVVAGRRLNAPARGAHRSGRPAMLVVRYRAMLDTLQTCGRRRMSPTQRKAWSARSTVYARSVVETPTWPGASSRSSAVARSGLQPVDVPETVQARTEPVAAPSSRDRSPRLATHHASRQVLVLRPGGRRGAGQGRRQRDTGSAREDTSRRSTSTTASTARTSRDRRARAIPSSGARQITVGNSKDSSLVLRGELVHRRHPSSGARKFHLPLRVRAHPLDQLHEADGLRGRRAADGTVLELH